MALLSNKTFLYRKSAANSNVPTNGFQKLVDITSYPDIGGAPDAIDVTTLSDMVTRNINGIQSSSSHEFGAWYDLDTYQNLNAIQLDDIENEEKTDLDTYQIWFGENGKYGIFEWQGKLSVFAGGAESNAARPMTITISDEGEDAIKLVSVSG